MIALSLNPDVRQEQTRFPTTDTVCGSGVALDGRAVRPFFQRPGDGGVMRDSVFLMTCVGNGPAGVSWFVVASHAAMADGVVSQLLPKKYPVNATQVCTWEHIYELGHDIALVKITGLEYPHASVAISREPNPISYGPPIRGWRACLISQGEGGSGEMAYWTDERGNSGPYGALIKRNDVQLKKWGEMRVLSADAFAIRAGVFRDDIHAGMSCNNSSAPLFLWNEVARQFELGGVTFGGFKSTYKLPDGRIFWEDGRDNTPIMVTAMPEGCDLIVGGGKVTRAWADSAVSSMSFDKLAVVAQQIETIIIAAGGNVVPTSLPTPQPSASTALVTAVTPGGLRNEYSGFTGCIITVGAAALKVTFLGRWMTPGNTRGHPMKLVDAATGQDVPGSLVNVLMAGPVNEFKYAPLPAPVTLQAGKKYYILSLETAGADWWQNWDCRTATTAAATVDGVVFQNGAIWGTYPFPGMNYGPVDLRHETP